MNDLKRGLGTSDATSVFSDAMKRREGVTVKRKKDGMWYIGVGILRQNDELSLNGM